MNLKHLLAISVTVYLLALQAASAAVTPVQANFGNVFPTLTDQRLEVFRSAADPPWYVTFNLLAQADVTLGVLALPPSNIGAVFDLTSIRVVRDDGSNVQFGTDTFSHNPFPEAVEQLVSVNDLPAGKYALEVSGSGTRINNFGEHLPDFAVHLQVVPEPEAYVFLLAGLSLGAYAFRRRTRS